jgi:hypothetical protein
MWEREIKMARKSHKKEKDALMMQIKELQQEMQSVKVSAACIWLCSIIGTCYFWLVTVPYE